MKKVHTRAKRMLGMSTHRRVGKPKIRKKRPKTFKTEASAKAWAEKIGIKDYKLVNLKNTEAKEKKLKIVLK
jgi:hypothetical protein